MDEALTLVSSQHPHIFFFLSTVKEKLHFVLLKHESETPVFDNVDSVLLSSHEVML